MGAGRAGRRSPSAASSRRGCSARATRPTSPTSGGRSSRRPASRSRPPSSLRNRPWGDPPAYQTSGSSACPGVSQKTGVEAAAQRSPARNAGGLVDSVQVAPRSSDQMTVGPRCPVPRGEHGPTRSWVVHDVVGDVSEEHRVAELPLGAAVTAEQEDALPGSDEKGCGGGVVGGPHGTHLRPFEPAVRRGRMRSGREDSRCRRRRGRGSVEVRLRQELDHGIVREDPPTAARRRGLDRRRRHRPRHHPATTRDQPRSPTTFARRSSTCRWTCAPNVRCGSSDRSAPGRRRRSPPASRSPSEPWRDRREHPVPAS